MLVLVTVLALALAFQVEKALVTDSLEEILATDLAVVAVSCLAAVSAALVVTDSFWGEVAEVDFEYLANTDLVLDPL